MKLHHFLNKFKIKTLKKEFHKNGFILYHLITKDTRELHYVVIVNEKTKDIFKKKLIAKNKIKGFISNFKKSFKAQIQALKDNYKLQNKPNVKRIKTAKKITKKLKEKNKKRLKEIESDFKFKNEKQKKDILYMWFVFSFLREHLIQNELVTIGKNNEPILKSDKMIDKKLLKFLNEVGAELTEKGLRDNSVKLDIIQNMQKTTYKKVISKTHQEDMYYIITLLYLLKMWKLDNDFKKLLIPIDNEFIEPYLEYMTNYLLKEDEKVTENSVKIAFYLFEEIYNKFPTKTFFRDKIAKKIITKG